MTEEDPVKGIRKGEDMLIVSGVLAGLCLFTAILILMVQRVLLTASAYAAAAVLITGAVLFWRYGYSLLSGKRLREAFDKGTARGFSVIVSAVAALAFVAFLPVTSLDTPMMWLGLTRRSLGDLPAQLIRIWICLLAFLSVWGMVLLILTGGISFQEHSATQRKTIVGAVILLLVIAACVLLYGWVLPEKVGSVSGLMWLAAGLAVLIWEGAAGRESDRRKKGDGFTRELVLSWLSIGGGTRDRLP